MHAAPFPAIQPAPPGAPDTAVVILNWNGAADTLACLRSIHASGDTVRCIVVDNGSTDGSLARLADGLHSMGLDAVETTAAAACPPAAAVWLIAAGRNLGFAAGCNLGLRAAAQASCHVVCFLNNDTVVEAGALGRLVHRLHGSPHTFATLPMITVFGSDRIWNCGGDIWPIGLRRYHLAGRPRAEGAQRGDIRCSFFTGCCLAMRTAEFLARGGFSERFFFGEEDVELALWLRERGGHALCVTSAVVQHKVGLSVARAADGHVARRVFVHYLNRFIHMRLRLGPWRWALWCAAYLPYVVALLLRRRALPAPLLPRFVQRLLARARVMDGVSGSDFQALMAGRW
jgi:GT2 family glycosyltransferase